MIFKLDVNQGIYICSEEEEEIIIPTETGFSNVGDYAKTYVLNGVENWGKNVQAEQAFHFAPFFDSCQSRRPNGESGKKSTFFYFDEKGEKLKKLEKFLVLTFSR